jgi:hypothetical protein
MTERKSKDTTDKTMAAAKIAGRAATFRVAAVETATAMIGQLQKGCRVVGITKGQFSLLDLIRACIVSTGPVNMVLSTWTAGIRDAENAGWMLEKGDLLSVELLVDRSFKNNRPKYCRRIQQIFGQDSILVSRTHAKFALLYNDDWSLVIRSSMNLNRNPRFEQFDIDDSPEMLAYFQDFVGEIRRVCPTGIFAAEQDISDGWNEALVCNTCGGEVMVPEDIDDILARITQLSGLQFTPKEIATMAGIEGDLSDDQYAAYLKGQLIAEEGVRRTLLAQAGSGDMKAIGEFNKLIEDRKRATKTYRRE